MFIYVIKSLSHEIARRSLFKGDRQFTIWRVLSSIATMAEQSPGWFHVTCISSWSLAAARRSKRMDSKTRRRYFRENHSWRISLSHYARRKKEGDRNWQFLRSQPASSPPSRSSSSSPGVRKGLKRWEARESRYEGRKGRDECPSAIEEERVRKSYTGAKEKCVRKSQKR